MKGLNNYVMPYLAQLYKEGKITLKQIASLMDLPVTDVINQIPTLIDDIQIESQAEQYSQDISMVLLPLLQDVHKSGLSFHGTIKQEEKNPEN